MRERKGILEKLQQIAPGKLTLGQRIRLIRGNKNQAEFGKLLNKSQDAISVYETDAVTPPYGYTLRACRDRQCNNRLAGIRTIYGVA